MEAAPTTAEFAEFCRLVCGIHLEPWQLRIADEWLGSEAEIVTSIARGQGKTSLAAAFALFHVIAYPDPQAYCLAATRDQAAILWRFAGRWALHPKLADLVNVRHLELRRRREGLKATSALAGGLRVLASDAPGLHGLMYSLAIVDELAQHRDGEAYEAMRSALHKRPGAKLIVISTAAADPLSPLGILRKRALARPVIERDGGLTHTRGDGLAMLDWSLPDDGNADDPAEVKASAAPASWISEEAIAGLRDGLSDLAFRRLVANQAGATESAAFPPGAWAACAGDASIEDGAEIVVAVDAGKGASDSAVVWVDEHLHVGAKIIEGTGTAHEIEATVDDLARRYRIREVVADPWHVVGYLTEAWEERGLTVVEMPQFDSRLVPATDRLHRAVTEARLTHPDDLKLNAHLDGSMLRDTRRGVRLDKRPGRNNDGMIALLMAVDRMEQKPAEPVRLVGWL